MNSTLGISIPTYKRPEQLLKTVRSVIAAGREFEIPIFISDDSTDSTNDDVISQLQSEYEHIKVFRNENNLGVDANIVASVDRNTCKYAWMLGEDDRLVQHGISRVLELLEKQEPPFAYVNYSSVNGDFSKTLKRVSLRFATDMVVPGEEFFRRYSWSAGFIGACVVRKADWDRVDRDKYIGTWFAHVGTIMELLHGSDVPVISEPLVLNRCGTVEVFSWTSSFLDVLDGWSRLCDALEPIYGKEACVDSLKSFRAAHGLGTVKFLAYARAGGVLTPQLVREQVLPGSESRWFKMWAVIVSRLPIVWFRTIQRWRNN